MINLNFLLDKNGNIIGKRLLKLDENIISNIIKETNFLKNSPKLSTRIKALVKEIKQHDKCTYCGEYLRYSSASNKIFNIICKCDGYKKSIDYSNRILKFKENCNKRKGEFKPSPILSLDYVTNILKNNKDKILESQYEMKKFIDNIDGLRESLFYYTKKINGLYKKISYLIYPHSCIVCGNDTRYISKEIGFRDRCWHHESSYNRINNKLEESINILKENGYNIKHIPDSIQSNFILKCDKGHTFEKILNNGKIYNIDDKLCPECHPRTVSKYEYEIKKFLNDNNIEVIQQYGIEKYKNGVKSIDLFLPKYNIGIEFNGSLWHSYGYSKYSKFNNHDKEDKNKHLYKTILCNKSNINLLHIFDFEWENKKDIWKSVILSKCGISTRIYARKCNIETIDNKTYRIFLDKNHLQGYAAASLKFGIFFNKELVGVMSFSKNRFSKKGDFELIRYCSKLNTNIVGGFSKLLAYFTKNNNGSIISYANKRWSIGKVYEKNGFNKLNDSNPNYWYIDKNMNIYSRLKFQKHMIDDGTNKTESEIMFGLGYRRLWDCGNIVYKYDN